MAIPMPTLDRSGLFEALVAGNQRKDKLKQMEQEWQQHLRNAAIREQQEERLRALQPYQIANYEHQAAMHPLEFLAKQQQILQAQQMGPLQVQNMQAQTDYHKAQAEDLANQQRMIDQFMNSQGGQQQQPPMQGQPQTPVMKGGQQMTPRVEGPTQEQIQQAFTKPRVHPAVAAAVKKKFGYDPNELTEDEKSQKRMAEFREKEAIKLQNKGELDLTMPTKAVITANQNVITAANNIIPQIQELKKMSIPNQLVNISPDQNQKYLGTSNAVADGLMAAFGWPKTDQALSMAKQMVRRGKLESEDAYKKRLDGLIGELEHRRKASNEILNASKVKPAGQEQAQAPGEQRVRKRFNPVTGMVE